MKSQVGTLALLTALVLPAPADEPKSNSGDQRTSVTTLKTTPDEIPEDVKRFNGMLVGRLAAKDIERGTFVVNVDTVSRVWRNSRAENPQALIGKAVQVGGVSGEWLDVLVTTRKGAAFFVLSLPGTMILTTSRITARCWQTANCTAPSLPTTVVADGCRYGRAKAR